MNVFLLGGTGFIGYHALQELLKKGHRVTIVALPPLPSEKLFPPDVSIHLANINDVKDAELLELLKGHDSLVHSAGIDDRVVPDAPAYPFFYKENVTMSERLFLLAKQAGIKQAVMLGSYYVHFERRWPELKLAERHPYIRTCLEQEDLSLQVCGDDIRLTILELPYVFGSVSGRDPQWKSLIRYISATSPIFYMRGGTACMSVVQVAEAIVGALENPSASGVYVLGDENLTWVQLLSRLSLLSGKSKKIQTLPNWMIRIGLRYLYNQNKKHGKENGLDPRYMVDLLTALTFIDPEPAREVLGFQRGGLEDALKRTVEASLRN
jgi:nucleoside-diphosphate-sugar epimerase